MEAEDSPAVEKQLRQSLQRREMQVSPLPVQASYRILIDYLRFSPGEICLINARLIAAQTVKSHTETHKLQSEFDDWQRREADLWNYLRD